MRKPVGIYANVLNLRCVTLEDLTAGEKYWMATCNPEKFVHHDWYSYNSLGGISFYAGIYVQEPIKQEVSFYDESAAPYITQQLNRPVRRSFNENDYGKEVWILKHDTIKDIFNGI